MENKNQKNDRERSFNEMDEFRTEEVVFTTVKAPAPMLPLMPKKPWFQRMQLPCIIVLVLCGLRFKP